MIEVVVVGGMVGICVANLRISDCRWAARLVNDLVVVRKATWVSRLRARSPDVPIHVRVGEVADMADVIRLGLSAGLSFDAALGLYCAQTETALSSLLTQARMSWSVGLISREEGLRSVAQKTGLRSLENFAAAVSQAHELGAPLAQTLSRQARELRAAHRAEIERNIEQAPVRMIIPTAALILPALLLSIIGPLLAAGEMI